MLHSRRPLQDENSSVYVNPKLARDTENVGLPLKTAAKGPRKALGNITNVAARGEVLLQGKTPASALPQQRKLRPLGDITNLKPTVKPPIHKPARESVAAAFAANKSDIDRRAELYATEGIESLAGKGWKQLQLEAVQREDQAIAARVAAIASIPYHAPVTFLSQVCLRTG